MQYSLEELTTALDAGEFFLEYMPIVSLSDGTCPAAEALVRWRREGQLISPLDFIPAFEESPLIGVLTYWIFEEISTELGPWLRRNPDFHIAINVPPELFGRGGLFYAGKVTGLLELRSQLVLELTERGTPDRITIEGMRVARRLGLGLAVDDVDEANVDIVLLARTKVDYLKLDRSVVEPLGHGPPPPLFHDLEPILRRGQPLVVAEGIETDGQLEILKQLGVPFGQGWKISRPLTRDGLVEFCRSAKPLGRD